MSESVKASTGNPLFSYQDSVNATGGDFAIDPSAALEFNPMNSKIVWAFSVLLVLVLARIFGNSNKLPAGAKRLPSVPGLPWLGRFWGIPSSGAEAAWFFGDFHKKLGPIYEWKTLGVTHIWIENDKIARDLLVHRSKKYADRQEFPAAFGLRDGSEILPLMGAGGDDFRRQKNFVHTIMRQSSAEMFYNYPVLENKNTIRRLLESPETWSESMITHCARVAARMAWADPKHSSKLLDVVPHLLTSQQENVRSPEVSQAFVDAQKDVMSRVKTGEAADSWMKLWLVGGKGMEASKLDQNEAAQAVGMNALVAITTIGAPLHSFFSAMCFYPSWMKKLQKEIDTVCGDRLPAMSDLPQLPVLRAIIKETLRWRQPTPLGVSHVATEDDIYEGYFIPKGAMVHANHYCISRDAAEYPLGNEFHPERWLESSWPTYREPLTEFPTVRGDSSFGYGARSCTGVELVLTELHTLVGALAWSFDIKKKEGREGHDNPIPWYETNPSVITMAKSFSCNVTVRSEAKRQYIANL